MGKLFSIVRGGAGKPTLTAIGHVDRDLTRFKKDIISAGKGLGNLC